MGYQKENQGALHVPLGVVRLKVPSEGRVCLWLADVKRYGVLYFASASTKLNS